MLLLWQIKIEHSSYFYSKPLNENSHWTVCLQATRKCNLLRDEKDRSSEGFFCWPYIRAVGAGEVMPPTLQIFEDQLTLAQPGGELMLAAPRIFRPSDGPVDYKWLSVVAIYVCKISIHTIKELLESFKQILILERVGDVFFLKFTIFPVSDIMPCRTTWTLPIVTMILRNMRTLYFVDQKNYHVYSNSSFQK